MTLGDKLDLTRGRPGGFDYLRILLALSVVCFHTLVVTYGQAFQDHVFVEPQWRLILAWMMPAFFALSGFLVAGSLERCGTMAGFLFLRGIRIFPALVVEILVSAFLLGPMMTHVSLVQYFTDPKFSLYLLNCLGDVHFYLPGLFPFNPLPGKVNGQLWTIPFELQCYVAITALAMAGVTRNSKAFLTLVFGLLGGCVFLFLRGHDRDIGSIPGHQLVVCFLIGVMMYKFRSNIPHNIRLFLVALAAALVCFWVPGGGLLSLLPVAYVTVFLGLLNPPKLAVLQTGDYSYGIFLYGFPIQQAVVASGLVPLNGWLTLLAAIPFILLVAVLSWHLWEKKMLELRCFRPTIDRNFGFTRPGLLKDRIFAISRARDGS